LLATRDGLVPSLSLSENARRQAGRPRHGYVPELRGAHCTVGHPATRMKAAKEHRVPLSDAALQVIEAMAKIRVYDNVFPGRNGQFSHAELRQVLIYLGRTDISVHGFRSTLRDWAAETTAYSREIAEMALAHAVGSTTQRAYQRGDLFDKRRQLADAWARFCAQAPAVSAEIVALRRRKAS
jgi:integrase